MKLLNKIFLCSVFIITFVLSAIAEESSSEKKAPTVRNIKIELRDVFDEPDLEWFYRTVNDLKISTKEEIIRRDLLIKEGEVFDPFLVEESERNLRSLSYLRQVSITPVFDGEYVDLIVSVQDTWTLLPQIGFSSGGGTDKKSFGISEGNLLGYGKRAEVLFADNDGRKEIQGVWDDRRFLGSYHRLLLGHFDRSDGFRNVALIGRPFRGLVEPYSWTINSDVGDLITKLYENGDERYIFRQRHIGINGGYTISRGVPDVNLRRYTFGFDFNRDEFLDADDQDFVDVDVDPDTVSRDSALLPIDRRFSGPYFAFQHIIPDFMSINYVDRFERVEDFNLGSEVNLRIGTAAEFFDSLESAFLVSLSRNQGWRITPTSFVRGEIGGAVRVTDDNFENTLARAELKYINVLGARELFDTYIGKHTIAGSISLDVGENLDLDREFLLGANSGLRGYEDFTFTGSNRFLVNLEDRVFLVEDIYKLFNLGAAFFVDAGGTSGEVVSDIFKNNFYADFGVGLRIGFPRSSSGSVLRIDVAFPVRDGADGSLAYEPRVLATLGQAFGARLRSETLGPERANVSIGQTP